MTNSAGDGVDQESGVHGALVGDNSWKFDVDGLGFHQRLVRLASTSGAVFVDGCPSVANDEPADGRGSQ